MSLDEEEAGRIEKHPELPLLRDNTFQIVSLDSHI